MFLELFQAVAQLVARDTQHFRRFRLIAAAAFDCLPHQRHFNFVERHTTWRQMK